MSKSPDAFRTISEVAEWLEIQAHVLRFWESKFTQVKPVKRAGGRRYYRPSDMLLLGGIQHLVHDKGMSIKDAQAMIREQGVQAIQAMSRPLEGEEAVAPAPEAKDSVWDDRPRTNPETVAAAQAAPVPDPEPVQPEPEPVQGAAPAPVAEHAIAPAPTPEATDETTVETTVENAVDTTVQPAEPAPLTEPVAPAVAEAPPAVGVAAEDAQQAAVAATPPAPSAPPLDDTPMTAPATAAAPAQAPVAPPAPTDVPVMAPDVAAQPEQPPAAASAMPVTPPSVTQPAPAAPIQPQAPMQASSPAADSVPTPQTMGAPTPASDMHHVPPVQTAAPTPATDTPVPESSGAAESTTAATPPAPDSAPQVAAAPATEPASFSQSDPHPPLVSAPVYPGGLADTAQSDAPAAPEPIVADTPHTAGASPVAAPSSLVQGAAQAARSPQPTQPTQPQRAAQMAMPMDMPTAPAPAPTDIPHSGASGSHRAPDPIEGQQDFFEGADPDLLDVQLIDDEPAATVDVPRRAISAQPETASKGSETSVTSDAAPVDLQPVTEPPALVDTPAAADAPSDAHSASADAVTTEAVTTEAVTTESEAPAPQVSAAEPADDHAFEITDGPQSDAETAAVEESPALEAEAQAPHADEAAEVVVTHAAPTPETQVPSDEPQNTAVAQPAAKPETPEGHAPEVDPSVSEDETPDDAAADNLSVAEAPEGDAPFETADLVEDDTIVPADASDAFAAVEETVQDTDNAGELSAEEDVDTSPEPAEITDDMPPARVARQIDIADDADTPVTPGLLGQLAARLPEDESDRAILTDALHALTDWQARA
ncbi:hypothetical protein TRM7557_03044 [Tritonibacter multivorans]|uniref:HTH merR-type domain-containing protein n=1 Tax=Tritonibacter multivorans TaxID=928856 RepID=A0A0P1GGG2_9RHOB|nr:MerR family transcriptional regulator [Tritonibacter multivorans]MDA7420824.1 MerR family transcriptional regulator [Tritonibacter multivorans]CUH80685.1 hypothetical protein TRM7557_03044 [Tritonibacter multivorans]SFC85549.1 transcriptional regulator, MerR family [Tritonibacter multivorans]